MIWRVVRAIACFWLLVIGVTLLVILGDDDREAPAVPASGEWEP